MENETAAETAAGFTGIRVQDLVYSCHPWCLHVCFFFVVVVGGWRGGGGWLLLHCRQLESQVGFRRVT